MQGLKYINPFTDTARQSIKNWQQNEKSEGHIKKHIWDQKSQQTYGKHTSYFIDPNDIKICFRDASDIVSKGIYQAFTVEYNPNSPNRIIYEVLLSKKLQGKNWKGYQKNYTKIRWTFENKGSGWIVATAYPICA